MRITNPQKIERLIEDMRPSVLPTLKARLTATGWCEAVLERERADGVGERDLRPLRECARRLARARRIAAMPKNPVRLRPGAERVVLPKFTRGW